MSSIFKPVFMGTVYQGHECSECKERVKFSHISALDFFDMDIRFCPYCGEDIIRFDETPKFIEPLDVSVLEPITKVITDGNDKINWIYWCCFTEEQRKKCNKLFEFSSSYSWIAEIKRLIRGKPHHAQIKKLNDRFANSAKG